MGALPKNKITRVERGKRRRGNTPKLLKDRNSITPLHKQGFVAELMKFIGLETAPVSKEAHPKGDHSLSDKTEAPVAKKAAKSAVTAHRETRNTVKPMAPKKVIRKSDRT